MKAAQVVRENITRLLDENRLRKRPPTNHPELADRMGITRQNVTTILTSDKSMTLTTVERFADALGVEPWKLVAPPEAKPVDDSLDRDPGSREKVRFSRWARRQPEGVVEWLREVFGDDLVEAARKKKA